MVQAVEISAAHIAAKVIPEAKGSSPMITLGKAIVASIFGEVTLAIIPTKPHKTLFNAISAAPQIKPFRAEAESLAPQAI